jgi:ABC-type transporter lipoprotein component MlaA
MTNGRVLSGREIQEIEEWLRRDRMLHEQPAWNLIATIHECTKTIAKLRDYIEQKEGAPDDYQCMTIYYLQEENERLRKALE